MLTHSLAPCSLGQGCARALRAECAGSRTHGEARANLQLHQLQSKDTAPRRWSHLIENRTRTHDAKTTDLATAKCQLLPKVCLNLLKYWQNQKMQLNAWRTTHFGWHFSKVAITRNFSSYERKKLQASQCGYLGYKITGLPAPAIIKIA